MGVIAGSVQSRPAVDPNPDGRQITIASDLSLRCDCEPHGVGRVAEREHEAVADLLDELAVVVHEQGAHDGVDAVEEVRSDFVAAGFRERRERGDIDETSALPLDVPDPIVKTMRERATCRSSCASLQQ